MNNYNLPDLLMLLASAQGIFLGVFILHKYSSLLANRFLATLMFLHAAILLEMSLQTIIGLEENSRVVMFVIGLSFLVPPLHYLYAKYLTRPGETPTRREFLHCIPFLVFEVLVLAFYRPESLGISSHSSAEWNNKFGFFHLVVVLQYGAYLIQTQRVLRRYSQRVHEVFSTLEKIKLTWLRDITWLAMFVVFVYGLEYMLLSMGIWTGDYFVFSSFLLVFYVYAMGYLGLFKSEVLSSSPLREALQSAPDSQRTSDDQSSPAKYSKSGLNAEDLAHYQDKLLSVMTQNSPQSESSLTLDQLAAMVGLSPHNLSEVINRGLNQNFFDFVNGYRVQQVQESLLDPKKTHLTVLALSLEAGFASKSTFNSIFKKHTGLTPTAWRKQHSNS
jgi:AraC-like DNA-binding protein